MPADEVSDAGPDMLGHEHATGVFTGPADRGDPIPEGEVSLSSQGGSADIPGVPDRRGRAQTGGRLNKKNIRVGVVEVGDEPHGNLPNGNVERVRIRAKGDRVKIHNVSQLGKEKNIKDGDPLRVRHGPDRVRTDGRKVEALAYIPSRALA